MAVLSGMGFKGRNNLVINQTLGTRFIIAGCLIPSNLMIDTGSDIPKLTEAGSGCDDSVLCGTCGECAEACPTRALSRGEYPGVTFDKSRCLQYHSTRLEELPEFIMSAWGRRLYGCGICQEVCPYNKKAPPNTTGEGGSQSGVLGPSLSLTAVLSMEEEALKRLLKGTALGMSWIPPIAVKRNALLAAAHAGHIPERLRLLVTAYADHALPAIQHAAKWALSRMKD